MSDPFVIIPPRFWLSLEFLSTAQLIAISDFEAKCERDGVTLQAVYRSGTLAFHGDRSVRVEEAVVWYRSPEHPGVLRLRVPRRGAACAEWESPDRGWPGYDEAA